MSQISNKKKTCEWWEKFAITTPGKCMYVQNTSKNNQAGSANVI